MTRREAILANAQSIKEQGSIFIPGVGILTIKDLIKAEKKGDK